MNRARLIWATVILALLPLSCGGGGPDEAGLRDSFAAQLAANSFVSDVQHEGDEIAFSGPGPSGDIISWRAVIDSAVVEPNEDPQRPYRGTVTSSWYAGEQLIQPSGSDSNLPLELTSNGLAQECWALWNSASEQWEWE